MKTFPTVLLAAVISLGIAHGQVTLVSFDFTDAPTEISATTSAAETVAPGFAPATFSVVRQNSSNESQSGIANVAGSSGVGAAQVAGQQQNTYAWEAGSDSNYFEFTIDFGTVSAGVISFDSLDIFGRTGVQWSGTGDLLDYRADRMSTLTVRTSLDGFASNVGAEMNPSFSNTDNDWVTTSIDLTSLVLAGTEESVTFRLYTKTNASGTEWHRSQINTVEVTGVIPEPSVYAALLGLAALAFVVLRRR